VPPIDAQDLVGEQRRSRGEGQLASSAVDDSLLNTLAETGVAKLHSVFSLDDAERMREAVWRDLYDTDGVRREDRSTWHRSTPLRKLALAKRDPSFHALFGEPLRHLADMLLGEGWTTDAGLGQLLVSFPDTERWHLPGRDGFWHSDLGGRQSTDDPLPSIRCFAVFGDVPPGGGGTLLAAGSDRMIMRYVKANPAVERNLKADVAWNRDIPWLAELTLAELPSDRSYEQDEDRRRRFMEMVSDVDGIPAQVIEACGQPGDVYVCAPWTAHCKPPNASDRPRFLRSVSLYRGDGRPG
jgi:hypothetical protein